MMNKKFIATGVTAFALSAGILFGLGGSQTVQAAGQETAAITLKEAKKEALADAGFKKSDVVFKKAALDFDDGTGISKYEIDFYADDKDYEYDIDAADARIIKTDVESMDAEDYQEMKALQAAAAEKKAAKAAKKTERSEAAKEITADQALKIALKDAGLTPNDVSCAETNLDFDDDTGITQFEVEFHKGAEEYSYDINAKTGAIIECDVEIDD